MKLAKNLALLPITREGMGNLNLVLAWDDNHLVLVDAGLPGQTDAIAMAIANEGFRAEDLTHIIITHQDWDHVGSVSGLMKLAPTAKVVAPHRKGSCPCRRSPIYRRAQTSHQISGQA